MKKVLVISLAFLIGCKERHFVKYVSDGDTVILENGEHIRISDIDCPEKSQPFGYEAKHFTDSVLRDKEVNVIYSGQNSYNRKVAEIEIEGQNFASIIVSNGFAHVSTKYCHNEQLLNEYAMSKEKGIGLFSTYYQLPYQYRKSHKN